MGKFQSCYMTNFIMIMLTSIWILHHTNEHLSRNIPKHNLRILADMKDVCSVDFSNLLTFGSFYGVPLYYIKKGSNNISSNSVNDTILSIATMCDIKRLLSARQMVMNFMGPISISIYTESIEKEIQTKTLCYKIKQYFDSIDNKYDIYISLLYPDYSSQYYQYLNLTHIDVPFYAKIPINPMRNLAVSQVKTKYVTVLDVDFSFMSNTLNTINTNKHTNTFSNKNPEAVWIIPSFEWVSLNAQDKYNKNIFTKKELLQLIDYKNVIPFLETRFIQAQQCTNYSKWINSQENYIIKYCTKHYQPFIIINTDYVKNEYMWNNNYIGGWYDKSSQIAAMASRCLSFQILNDVFIIHQYNDKKVYPFTKYKKIFEEKHDRSFKHYCTNNPICWTDNICKEIKEQNINTYIYNKNCADHKLPLLYSFNDVKWLIVKNHTNTNCNKAIYIGNPHDLYGKKCCLTSYDNKHIIAEYSDKCINKKLKYNSTKYNDVTMCDLLLIMSNKSILIAGDSISQQIFNNFIRDIFEKRIYQCHVGYITNIEIENVSDIADATAKYKVWTRQYKLSFDYHYSNNDVFFSRKHIIQWSLLHFWKMIPSFAPNDISNYHFSFNLNKAMINYSMLGTNLTDLIGHERKGEWNCLVPFKYLKNMIKEFDSVIVNLGPHYERGMNTDAKRNTYKYVINYVANILQNDMLSSRQKVNIWRMSLPAHFSLKSNGCSQTASKRYDTNKYEFEIFRDSNYSVPVIDYYSVLKSRGDLHILNKSDCLHWCASNNLWKGLWFLLSQIYTDYGWTTNIYNINYTTTYKYNINYETLFNGCLNTSAFIITDIGSNTCFDFIQSLINHNNNYKWKRKIYMITDRFNKWHKFPQMFKLYTNDNLTINRTEKQQKQYITKLLFDFKYNGKISEDILLWHNCDIRNTQRLSCTNNDSVINTTIGSKDWITYNEIRMKQQVNNKFIIDTYEWCPWLYNSSAVYPSERNEDFIFLLQFLNSFNLTYRLSHGSALGLVRNHGRIPKDHDIDVYIPLHLNDDSFLRYCHDTNYEFKIINHKLCNISHSKWQLIFFEYFVSATKQWNIIFGVNLTNPSPQKRKEFENLKTIAMKSNKHNSTEQTTVLSFSFEAWGATIKLLYPRWANSNVPFAIAMDFILQSHAMYYSRNSICKAQFDGVTVLTLKHIRERLLEMYGSNFMIQNISDRKYY